MSNGHMDRTLDEQKCRALDEQIGRTLDKQLNRTSDREDIRMGRQCLDR